jgi:hypothetical protein
LGVSDDEFCAQAHQLSRPLRLLKGLLLQQSIDLCLQAPPMAHQRLVFVNQV